MRGLIAVELKITKRSCSFFVRRILGRVSVHDIQHPLTGKKYCRTGEEITEAAAKIIQESPIERVEIRSVLTCESKKVFVQNVTDVTWQQEGWFKKEKLLGYCSAVHWRTRNTVTLRTHSTSEVLLRTLQQNQNFSRYDGILEIEELRTVTVVEDNNTYEIVVSRLAEPEDYRANNKSYSYYTKHSVRIKAIFQSGDK